MPPAGGTGIRARCCTLPRYRWRRATAREKDDFLVVQEPADPWIWCGNLDIHVIIITFLLKLPFDNRKCRRREGVGGIRIRPTSASSTHRRQPPGGMGADSVRVDLRVQRLARGAA